LSEPKVMIVTDLPPLPVDSESEDLENADRDLDFVNEAEVERLLTGRVSGEAEEGAVCLLAASDEDFAAAGGWMPSGERADGGVEEEIEVRLKPLARDLREKSRPEPVEMPEIKPERQTDRVTKTLGGRVPMVDETKGRMASRRRQMIPPRRSEAPNRARPPQLTSAGAARVRPGNGSRVPGSWVMFVSALVSSVLFILGAILVQSSTSGEDWKAGPPASVERLAQPVGEIGPDGESPPAHSPTHGKEWMAGEPQPAR